MYLIRSQGRDIFYMYVTNIKIVPGYIVLRDCVLHVLCISYYESETGTELGHVNYWKVKMLSTYILDSLQNSRSQWV